MKIISVVGARPNFMKIAPFIKAIEHHNEINDDKIVHTLIHTGQHYDDRMSDSFFKSLGIPNPDINLGVGSGSHAEQVGNTMIEFEKVITDERPDWVVVVGDVNATLACSVTAKKHHVKVCHIEAGLRSGDEKMPEEINRLVTDRLSDLLLTPDLLSNKNLINEGVPDEKIRFVGNIMIDTLEDNRNKALEKELNDIIRNNLIEGQAMPIAHNLESNDYALMTMHRPSNVDAKSILTPMFRFLTDEVTADLQLVWPIHPRTQKMLAKFGLWEEALANYKLILLHPIGYHDMLRLNMDARIMLTDSGGLQEECCVLGTPCLTLRWNTERPITLRENGGASVLVGNNVERIRDEYAATLKNQRQPLRPELWDGKTAQRCVKAILNY
jgi:UDP-N-acetylglucosamine 2-epimerase (non-hydrolysing)